MFGTLHWNSQTKEAEFIERPHGSSNPEMNSACDRCRAKKVKCSTNGQSCSRCRGLRKKCTFSSVKQRGNQKGRKGNSIDMARQERSIGLTVQPQPSPSPKATGNEEEAGSDKRPFTSSPPADGNDDSDRGQHLLAEPLTDSAVDIPPNLDLSFLAEYCQQTNDQEGDDIFNLTLLPFPFFSSGLPCTQPDSIQPAAIGTSDNLISSPFSAGEETPHFLPPSRQSQDSPLFDIGSIDTPTSSDTSALISTAFLSQNTSGQSCKCLATVIFAVEEFEASCNSGNRAELDSIIANQKKAIKCCRSMIQCSNCMAKRENIVLLVFVTERIVVACGKIVVLYRMKDSDTWVVSVPPFLQDSSSSDRLSHDVNVEDRDFATSASSPSKTDCAHPSSIVSTRPSAPSDWQELLLGDYEISSSLEWEHLVRVLISLQLRAVMGLLADVKCMGNKILGETQTASLAQAEIRVGELEKDIRII